MSEKEDDDKTKMCQCERRLMVIQGIKDRSKIRTRRRVSVRQRGDLGEIQGRSIDLRGSMFRGVGIGKGIGREGVES